MQETNTIYGCKCRRCGAQLVTQLKTADTYCRMCGEPALTAQNYENAIIPEYALDFEIDKAAARNIFVRHLAQRPLVNGEFIKRAKSGHFAAVYIPVCLTDVEMLTDITSQQGNISIESSAGDIVSNLSACTDKLLFSLLAPYNFEKLVPYGDSLKKIPFEFFSAETAEEKAKEKIEELEIQALTEGKNAIQHEGYLKHDTCIHTVTSRRDRYALLPVWVLSCNTKTYSGRLFINGQTGKVIGNPPPSITRMAGIFGAIVAACTVIGEIIYTAVNGL